MLAFNKVLNMFKQLIEVLELFGDNLVNFDLKNIVPSDEYIYNDNYQVYFLNDVNINS